MFLPFIGAEAPIEQKTLTLIQKPAIVQEKPKELTLAEKIATNYYKCNTDIQWIRADNAECLDKAITSQVASSATPAQKPVKTAYNGSNGYEYHSCTWWVKNWKPSVGDNWGNANNWGYAARAEGWVVTPVPQVGAVAWTTAGQYGHVALVIGINGDQVAIKEGNYDWNGSVRTTIVPVGQYQYIY